jgi:hypothetical protein
MAGLARMRMGPRCAPSSRHLTHLLLLHDLLTISSGRPGC